MINVLIEDPIKQNVWLSDCNVYPSPKFKRSIPMYLGPFEDEINLITVDHIDDVDFFIYPIMMDNPYIQCRQLIQNYDVLHGFWTLVHPKVIEALKQDKGRIIIEISNEPILAEELEMVLASIEDSSVNPNDKIRLFVDVHSHINHKNTFEVPKPWEIMFCKPGYSVNWPLIPRNTNVPKTLEKRRFACFNGRADKHWGAFALPYFLLEHTSDGYITLDNKGKNHHQLIDSLHKKSNNSSFEKREWSELPTEGFYNLLQISQVLEKVDFNIVVEAYLSDKSLSYPLITEKTFRSIGAQKPFVVVGQRHTLKKLHSLGYKTFHPIIDESYDNEKDDFLRFLKAVKTILKLIDLNDDAIEELLTSIQPVFDYNAIVHSKRLQSIKKHLTK